jgi:cytochrome c oxidase cbb3-type subunit 3
MNTTPDSQSDANDRVQLTGHEYDGITEYDNPMPTWWRRIFWATFVFSIGYYVHYQLTGNGASVEDNYTAEMREQRELQAAAALGQETTEESLTRLMQDPAMMKDARSIFVQRCVQCHADRGQGNIGPNLTDAHWIYGSATLMDLLEIVTNGRPQKGMPVWSRVLRPVELAEAAAYVGTLRNTNVPGRPPQGTLVTAPQAGAEHGHEQGAAAPPGPTSVATGAASSSSSSAITTATAQPPPAKGGSVE